MLRVVEVAAFSATMRDSAPSMASLDGQIESLKQAKSPADDADESARLRDLADKAAALFEAQPAAEKRKLLDCMVSGAEWKGGELVTVFREPFAAVGRPIRGL